MATSTKAITYEYQWGQTLDDCRDFAELFDNTCDLTDPEEYEVLELDETDSVRISCQVGVDANGDPDPNKCGSFYNSGTGLCEWDAVLCVTCVELFSQVYIRIQSNGLP